MIRSQANPPDFLETGCGGVHRKRPLMPLSVRPRRRAALRLALRRSAARFQILLLELSGVTLLLLDEPTDNLDVQSAVALEDGLEAFEGTVIAVYETTEPVWDEGRVNRVR